MTGKAGEFEKPVARGRQGRESAGGKATRIGKGSGRLKGGVWALITSTPNRRGKNLVDRPPQKPSGGKKENAPSQETAGGRRKFDEDEVARGVMKGKSSAKCRGTYLKETSRKPKVSLSTMKGELLGNPRRSLS